MLLQINFPLIYVVSHTYLGSYMYYLKTVNPSLQELAIVVYQEQYVAINHKLTGE